MKDREKEISHPLKAIPSSDAWLLAVVQSLSIILVADLRPIDPVVWYPLIGSVFVFWFSLCFAAALRSGRTVLFVFGHKIILHVAAFLLFYTAISKLAPAWWLHRAVGSIYPRGDEDCREETKRADEYEREQKGQ